MALYIPTQAEIDECRKNRGAYLKAYYGNDDDDTIVQFLQGRQSRRNKRASANDSLTMELPAEVASIYDQKVAEYTAKFTEATPNDVEAIRNLAAMEVQLESIRRRLFTGSLAGEELKALVDAQSGLSVEHRQLQKMLGIDRKTREELVAGDDTVSTVNEIVHQAADFYRSKIVEINHCGIKIGHILAHFDGWEFSILCPRCGEEVKLSKGQPEVALEVATVPIKRARKGQSEGRDRVPGSRTGGTAGAESTKRRA